MIPTTGSRASEVVEELVVTNPVKGLPVVPVVVLTSPLGKLTAVVPPVLLWVVVVVLMEIPSLLAVVM